MRCSIYIATSLDGFIARKDGDIDWLSVVERAGEDYGYRRFHDSVDTVVVGRNTYELALGFETWPYVRKRCIVLTHAALASRHAEEFASGDVSALVEKLSASGAKRVYVDGAAVIQQFLAAGLITDVTISILPILIGDGVRLFDATGRDIPLSLVTSRSFPSGLVQIEYALRPPS
jgi:dihydrofolate reductase